MKILIALVGTSPAVVTETLWALANPNVPPDKRFLPDKLVLITTGEGRAAIEDELLKPSGRVAPLVALATLVEAPDLAVEGRGLEIRVPVAPLTAAKSTTAQPDQDVHTGEELGRMGDLIFSTVREFTSIQDSSICMSISGGRKTMSHLAGTAMAMLARPADFMTHVLVHPPWLEQPPHFFFPRYMARTMKPPSDWVLRTPTETVKEVKQDNIRVELSDVPFLRLRQLAGFDKAITEVATVGFHAAVLRANDGLRPDKERTLFYDCSQQKVFLDGMDIETAKRSDGKTAILQSPFVQIAALRCFAQPEGMPLMNLNPSEFRLFMKYWLEMKSRDKHFPLEQWKEEYVEAFLPDDVRKDERASAAAMALQPSTLMDQFSDSDFSGTYLRKKGNQRTLGNEKSRLTNAFDRLIGGMNSAAAQFEEIEPANNKRGGSRYRLPSTFRWNE